MANLEMGKIIAKLIYKSRSKKTDVAKHLGIARSTLDKYIKGTSKIPENIISDLAKYFEVPISTLYENYDITTTNGIQKTDDLLTKNGDKKMNETVPMKIYDHLRMDLEKEKERVDRLITLLENKYGGNNGQKKAV